MLQAQAHIIIIPTTIEYNHKYKYITILNVSNKHNNIIIPKLGQKSQLTFLHQSRSLPTKYAVYEPFVWVFY